MNNLTYDTSHYLGTFGISYVVIDNMSAKGLYINFGTSNLTRVVHFFDSSPGLTQIYRYKNETWLFSTPVATMIGAGYFGVSCNNSEECTSELPAAFDGAGISTIFVPQGAEYNPYSVKIGYPSSSPGQVGSVNLFTPSNVSATNFADGILAFSSPTNATSSSLTHTGEFSLNYTPSNWTVSIWKAAPTPLSVNILSTGVLSMNVSSGSSTASINYLSSLVSGKTNGIHVDPGDYIVFKASAEVSGLNTGPVWLNVVGSNQSLVNSISQVGAHLIPSDKWNALNLTGVLPTGTSYFTLRIFSNVSGSLLIRKVSLQWNLLSTCNDSFTGATINARNMTLGVQVPITNGSLAGAVQVRGDGQVSILPNQDNSPPTQVTGTTKWVTFQSGAAKGLFQIKLTGNISLDGGIIVYTPLNVTLSHPKMSLIYANEGGTEFKGSLNATTPTYIRLDSDFNTHWLLSIPGGISESPFRDPFGDTLFFAPPGNYKFTIELTGISILNLALIVTGSAFILIGIILTWPQLSAILTTIYRSTHLRIRRQ
jgi:hypothetical protein